MYKSFLSQLFFIACLLAGLALLAAPGPALAAWTTTTVDSTNSVGLDSSIAIGTDGLPIISYFDGINYDLKVAKCGNAGCTSGNTITTVDSTGDIGFYSSVDIAIGADGLPVISYLDWSNNDLKVAKCGNAGCTSGNTLTTVDSTGWVGYQPSVAIGTDGLPVISYWNNTNSDLKVAKCGNAACSSGNTLTTIDSAGSVGSNNSITIGTDGLPVISYRDNTNADLKVAKCGNAGCTSGNILTTVDSAGSVGTSTSIAIGTDGLPVISYQDGTNYDLKVAKCGNAGCTSGNILTTVDSAGEVAYSTSIAIGTDGLPVISYADGTGGEGDLKVAKCGNAGCTSGNTLTTIDSAGSVGYYLSITIGTDGLPVISYLDSTNNNLKVAKDGGGGSGGGGVDCGVRMYDGTSTVTIDCEDPPVSPLRIQKGATTYGIQLVPFQDPNASRIRIQTPAGVKALRKQ